MSGFSESVVEQTALAWLQSAGSQVRNGVAIARDEPAAEREVMLSQWRSRSFKAAPR